MLPENTNTLLASWQGPFTVVKLCSPVSYIIEMRGNYKVSHRDMLKHYYTRNEDQAEEISTLTLKDIRIANTVSIIDNSDEEGNGGFSKGIPFLVLKQTETWHVFHINSDLLGTDRSQVLAMLEAYVDVLMDIPGSTNATHVITLFVSTPIRVCQYSLPLHYEYGIKTKITQLLNMGVVEYSGSAYSAPIFPVLK